MSSLLLSDCEALKSKANGLMKEGLYEQAIEEYTKVVDVLCSSIDAAVSTDGPDNTDSGDSFDAQFSVYVSCLNNLSMAYLKLDRLQDCIQICDRAINIDNHNLKAYYRRASAYKTLGAMYDRLPGNGGKEMNAEEELLWKHAEDDVECILAAESANKQALDLKKEIRRLKLDKETANKYNIPHRHMHGNSSNIIEGGERDLSEVFREKSKIADESYKNSVFKGFPEQSSATPSHSTIPNENNGGSGVTEKDISAFQQRQLAIAREQQQAQQYASSSAHAFLSPTWQPEGTMGETESVTAQLDQTIGILKSNGNVNTSSSDGTKPEKKNSHKKPSSSFRELLSSAKNKSKEKSATTRKKTLPLNAGQNNKKGGEVGKTEAVVGALQELSELDSQATQKYLETLTLKEKVASTRGKGSKEVKARLGKHVGAGNEGGGVSGGVGKEWEDLLKEEAEAKVKVKELLSARNAPKK